jgi:glycolate oxidase FAD binding subunit
LQNVIPEDESELASAIKSAADNLQQVEIFSAATKRIMGRPVEAEIRLDMSKISGIVRYEPDELILTAKAATPLKEINAALRERRQMLAFAPPDWAALFGEITGRATLAGTVGANACGARKIKAGAVRDHLIGCRFVNGSGEAIKSGGRVVKNVTGFDLPKIMCGAFGTLGVLTELTFRVVPAPTRAPAIAIRNCTPEDGLTYLRQAARLALEPTGLAYLPTAVCGQSPATVNAGLAQTNGVALIRVEGAEDPVIDKLARLRNTFSKQDIAVLEDDITQELFREIENGGPFLSHDTDIWRLFVPATKAHAAVTKSEAQFWYADWAGEGLWLGLPASRDVAERMRTITAELGGYALIMRAAKNARARLPVFEPEPPARAALSRAVKTAFDPLRILNPGRMYEEL